MIEAICKKKLYNIKVLILKTPIPTPPVDEIEITVSKPGLSNINSKLVTVTQSVSMTNLIFIIKSKKLPDPLMFNRN